MLDLLLKAIDDDSLDNAFTDPNTGENFSYEIFLKLYKFYLNMYINDIIEEYTIINKYVVNPFHALHANVIARLLVYTPELVDYFPKNEKMLRSLVSEIIQISIFYSNIFSYDPIEFIREYIPPEEITDIVIGSLTNMSMPRELMDMEDDYVNLALEFLDYADQDSIDLDSLYQFIINKGLMYEHLELFDYKTMMLNKAYTTVLRNLVNPDNENLVKALKLLYDLNPVNSKKIARDYLSEWAPYNLANPQDEYEVAAYKMSQDVLSRSYSYL